MPIPLISRTNTIDEWRVQTNLEATALNNLEAGNYAKSNGSLSLTANSSLIITANGTALQVSNGALFQSNVTVGGDIALGTQGSATGNLTSGGLTVILGPGNALQVANNATVNTDLQVTRTIYTGNISANGNVTVGGNSTIGGVVRLNNSGTALYVNTGTAVINTAVITNSTIGNIDVISGDIETLNVTSHLNVQSALVTIRSLSPSFDALVVNQGKTTVQDFLIQGNLSVSGTYTQTGNSNIEIDTITLNSNTNIDRDANIVNNRISGNNAVIQWNEIDKNWKVSRGNTYTSLNNVIDSSYVLSVVTSNSTTNVASASAAKAAFDTAVIAGGYANSAYTSQNTTGVYANTAYAHANAAYVSQNTTGVYANTAYLHANAAYVSQNTTGVYANSAYAHANTRFASAGGTISGAVVINGNLTVTGTQTYVNSTITMFADPILTLNADWPMASAPIENAGIEVQRGTSANTVLRWNETTDRWEFTNDGANYGDIASTAQVTAAGSYANSAYTQANTSTTNAATADQRAVTSGSFANSAYTQANTATTNAATADQRAVTSGSFANSAYLQANTATTNAASANTNANSRVLKAGDTMTGALIVQSTIDATGTITAPLFSGTATAARYADLAEKYTTDVEYSVGTVVVVNTEPDSEATKSTSISQLVLGVISEKPAYLMNSESTGQAIALRGRVPVRVIGPVKKGQTLVSGPNGTASVGEVNRFAIALESKDTHEEGNIEVVIL